jgi:hypothetical protein
MRLHSFVLRTGLNLAAGLLLAVSAGALAAQSGSPTGTSAAPSPTPAVGPKAVFVNDALTGKDPFFPDSQRRRAVASVGSANLNSPPAVPWAQLVLKGISWDKDHRLAIVNNVTLAEGEKAQVKANGQTLNVQCIEIRERSVLISIEGTKEVKEIRFLKE